MRRLLAIALLVIALPLAAQSRFTNRDLNFSVSTPGSLWRWSTNTSDGAWVVTSSDGERFSISVSSPGHARIDESWMGELLRTVNRDALAHGERIEGFRQTRATSPIFPSFNYAYTRVTRDGKKTFVDGWVAAAGRIYALQYASHARESLGEFRAFVESFQIADKFESQRAARGAAGSSPVAGAPPLMTDVLGRPIAPNSIPTSHH